MDRLLETTHSSPASVGEALPASPPALIAARIAYGVGLATVFWDQFLTLEVSGFHAKFAYFLLAGALGLHLLAGDISFGRRGKVLLRPLWRSPYVFMTGFAVLSFGLTIVSPQVKKSLGYSAWALFDVVAFGAGGIALFASGRPGDQAWRARLVWIWTAGVALVALIGIIDFAAYFQGAREGLIGGFQPHVLGWAGGGLPRPLAFSYEPSYLALAICLPLPVVLLRLLLPGGAPADRRRVIQIKAACAACLLVMTVAQVLVFSRTGLVMFFLEAALVFLYLLRKASRTRIALAAAGLVAIGAVSFALIPREQRSAIYQKFVVSLFNRTDASAQGRLHVFLGGVELARDNPWGSGPGTAMWRWQNYFEAPEARAEHPQQATSMMSLWPEIVIEQGIVGLALFVAFLIALIWRLSRNGEQVARGLLIALLVVAGFDFLFLPTVLRADLWSLFALCGIHAAAGSPGAAKELA